MAFNPGNVPAYLHDFEWAIIYLPTLASDPFIKVPIPLESCLAGQAAVGIDTTYGSRMQTYSGTIANNVFSTYKILMICHDSFFRHMDNMVDLANAFYRYCFSKIDPSMSRDTAFALTSSLFPAETKRDWAIHVLLSPQEVKDLMKDPRPAREIFPVILNPIDPPEESVVT